MKKVFSVVLTVCLIFGIFSFASTTVSAAQSGSLGSCNWQLNGTELIISGNGDMGYNVSWPWGQNITKLTIAEGVTSVGIGAFRYCSSLKSVTLPKSLKKIENFAFLGCSALPEIIIPDGVTFIGASAFSDCEKITEVNIPASVTNIEMGVFDNCYLLEEITVEETNPNYLSLDGVLFNKSQTNLIKYPNNRAQYSYSIPNTVTRIEHSAFMDAWYLRDISIPDTVTYIGINPFHGTPYYNNKSNYVDGILYLGKHLLVADGNISSITIREDTKTIADGAFTFCENIKEIVIPDGVVTIGGNAFAWCSSLEKVYIPKSVKTIGESAFYDCTQLENIYYSGNAADRNDISVQRYNSQLDNINWHYEACYSSPSHTLHTETVIIDNNNVVIKKCLVCGYEKHITNGWFKDGSIWEFYQNGVKLKNCWIEDSVGWCYLGADGYMLTNTWVKDSVGWCYVGADGYCATNTWVKDSKGWCYLGADGRMVTNKWVRDSQGWCYVGADGYCVTNTWVKDSKGWCYLDANGRMVTNKWVKDSKGWCYVGADGYAVTNCWKKDSVGWCYLDSNGNMTKSAWVLDGGKWYYLNANGYMVTGRQTIGGKVYTFNTSGVWIA